MALVPLGRTLPFPAALLLLAVGCGVQAAPASLSVVEATDLGPIKTNPDILGRDGGYSALFHGYSVWVYGIPSWRSRMPRTSR